MSALATKYFHQLDTHNIGYVTALQVKDLFTKSKLPRENLRDVSTLVFLFISFFLSSFNLFHVRMSTRLPNSFFFLLSNASLVQYHLFDPPTIIRYGTSLSGKVKTPTAST